MKRYFIFLMTLLIPALAGAGIRVQGQIQAADHRPPKLAHIHLTRIAEPYTQPLKTVAADAKGHFVLDIDKPGLYKLWASGVDHKIFGFPLILKKDHDEIQIDITLEHNRYRSSFDEVQIIGDWNNFNFQTAEPMQKQSDGTFTYEVKSSADSVAYQLLKVVDDTRSINGTQSDAFVYDGGGDYRSMVRVKNGHAKITFDPKKLQRIENSPTVKFDDRHPVLQTLVDIDQTFAEAKRKYFDAYRQYRKEHGDMQGFTFDLSGTKKYLQKYMAPSQNELVRQFATIQMVDLGTLHAKLDSAFYSQAIEIVPPTSGLWSMLYFAPQIFAFTLPEPQAEKVALQFARENPEKMIRGMALVALASKARQNHQQEKYLAYFKQLKEKFGDDRDFQFYLKDLDPNKRIKVGNAVPDFSVKLMGSGETVSNESLKGKYYLMDFWAVWCGPCVGEMPNLHAAYQKFKDKNFTILSLSFDRQPEDVQKFRSKKWKMPWLHTFVQGGFQSELAKKFEVLGIPKPILVGPNGKILATERELRGKKLEQTLEKFLLEKGTNDE